MSAAPAALRRVAVEQLRIGMHVHALDGAWADHPFWRRRFKLSDPVALAALQASKVRFCWIDVSKGVDVAVVPAFAAEDAPAVPAFAPPLPTPTPALAVAVAVALAVPEPPAVHPPPTTSMADEMQRAQRLLRSSRAVVVDMMDQARLGKAIDAQQCRPLVQEITDSVMRQPGALVSLSRLKANDDYTYLHSVAVCALMVALARTVGLDAAACREAGVAGLLHDVGKAVVPLEILNKPGALSEAEWRVMRSHPELGHSLLIDAHGASEAALDVCMHHHERMDGNGYPRRLPGSDISLLARMGALCDVYDALTSARPYKPACDPALAIGLMGGWEGQFDPSLFSAFVTTLGIYPVGSLVRLHSGRLAVVTEHRPDAMLTPTVRVFFSTRSMLPIPTEMVDLARPDQADRIVAREPRHGWHFAFLDKLWLPMHGDR